MSSAPGTKPLRAFLIAPLIVPFVLLLPFPGQDQTPVVNPAPWWATGLYWAIFSLPVSYTAEMLLGIPAWLLFSRFQIRSFFAFAAGGAIIGMTFYFGMEALLGAHYPYPAFAPNFYINLIGGTACALVFRTIVFWGDRPEARD